MYVFSLHDGRAQVAGSLNAGFHLSPHPQANILHVRALVKADTVILFDTYGSADSRLHSVFVYHLEVCTASFL